MGLRRSLMEWPGSRVLLVVLLSALFAVVTTCGCGGPAGGNGGEKSGDTPSGQPASGQPGTLTIDNWDSFLSSKAELVSTADNPDVEQMAAAAYEYLRNEDPAYAGGDLPLPEIGYYRTELDGRSAGSFYLYWLPDGWEERDVGKAILFSHGHGQRLPVGFSKLQRYAVERDMAIFMPQIWIESEPPAGYEPYKKSPRDVANGLPDGYHLDAEDQYMFLNSMADDYGVDSVYLYGFSISGAIAMQVAAYDHYGPDVVDLAVVSGGTMDYDHHFLDDMKALGLEDFFEGESFFFFGEYRGAGSHSEQEEQSHVDEIIVENSGELVMYEWRDVPHGGLLNQLPELMDESFVVYDRLSAERLGAEGPAVEGPGNQAVGGASSSEPSLSGTYLYSGRGKKPS